MSLEKIQQVIIEEAQQEVEKIVKEAEGKVRQVREAAKKEAEENYQRNLKELKLAITNKEERYITESQVETGKAVLQLKNQLIDEVFEKVKHSLLRLNDKDYLEFINRYLVLNLTPDINTVIIDERDKKRITKLWLDNCTRNINSEIRINIVTSPDIEGGFILKGEKVEIECTLNQLIQDKKEELKPRVSKVLF
ncbi:MAG: V-type ATP synthase subunit E [bacterium]